MNKFKVLSLSIIVFSLFLFSIKTASAANLLISPAGIVTVGQNFSVQAYVATGPGESMNSAEGTIEYPTDLVQLISISKGGSIFSLWTTEPTFSNANGSAHFEGVLFNPGYSGAHGTLVTFTFKAKAEGSGTIKYTSGSVLANDGKGTDILNTSSGSSFTIKSAPVVSVTPAPSPSHTPTATPKPIITPLATSTEATTTLSVPQITSYSTEVDQSGSFIVKGKADPNVFVSIYIKDANGQQLQKDVPTTAEGQFISIWDQGLTKGIYTVSTESFDLNGAHSSRSPEFQFVSHKENNSMLNQIMISYVIAALALLAAIVMSIIYFTKKPKRKTLTKASVTHTENSLKKSFQLLKEDVKERMKTSTPEEKKFLKNLMKDLTDAEEYLESEVKNDAKVVEK